MKTITPAQIRAVRSFLGFSQKELAKKLSVSSSTITNWERDSYPIPINKMHSIFALLQEYEIQLIEDRGFEKKSNEIKVFSGQEGLKLFFDDLYNRLLSKSASEVCVFGVDISTFREKLDFADLHIKRMTELNPEIRAIIQTSSKGNLTSYAKYLAIPDKYFSPYPIYVFDNRIGILSWDPLEIIVHDNEKLAEAMKKIFNLVWFNMSNLSLSD
jgi:transcriptional regulator with XRE-family HTH domain